MQEQPLEPRVSALEIDLIALKAKLESQAETQGNIDIALLARIDNFITDLHRLERNQLSGYDDLKKGIKEIQATQASQAQDIATLAAGQQQIIQLLTGKSRRDD